MIELELENLSLAYGRNVVVRDLTFRVAPGEMVGLIGPNGSGKSTVIRARSAGSFRRYQGGYSWGVETS